MIADRSVRPTAMLPFWHLAGFALGAVTAALGEKAAMACTVAVEEAIDAHYTAQLETLGTTEPALRQTVESFRAGAASADWVGAAKNDFYVLFLDSPGAQSWPITATTYILVYKNPPDQKATQDTLKFFQWSLEKGDQLALGLDYVPLPDNAVKSIEASWKAIQGSGM